MERAGRLIDARERFSSRSGTPRPAEKAFEARGQPDNPVRLSGRRIGPETDLDKEMSRLHRQACALHRRSKALLKDAEVLVERMSRATGPRLASGSD